MASNIIFDTAIITEAAPEEKAEEKAEETEKEAELLFRVKDMLSWILIF